MPSAPTQDDLTVQRITAQLARDRTSAPKVTRREEVPSSVEAITLDWWTDVLCRDAPGARVTSHAIVGHSSGTHARHRHALTYNEAGQRAGLPAAVFTKTLPDLVTRMIGGYNGTARAEGRFYLQIRPHLTLETPRGYFSAVDRETYAGINVIEDIATSKQATFCSFRTDVTKPMAEEMIDLLAALHGQTWESVRHDGDWKWVQGFADWFRVGSAKMETERYTQESFDRAAHLIPADVMKRRHDVWPATIKAAAIHERAPRSILHSDVHIGNWYQTGAGRMGICDWQCVNRGHWSRDVAYMLSTALTRAHRAAWERDLLKRYLEQLRAQGGTAPPLDAAWDAYRAQMMHALWMWTITLCHSALLPAMQPEETSLVMIERMAGAVSDLGSIDAALTC